MGARILVAGSVNMDLMMKVEAVPGPGETVLGDMYEWIPGGKGANQAVAAARLGAFSAFCGRTGDDAQGRTLRDSLKSDRVDTRFLRADADAPTGLAVIPVDAVGRNRIMVFPGANMRLMMDDIAAAMEEPFDAVMLQLEIPLEVVYGTIKLAQEKGIRTVLDAGPARAVELGRLAGLDIISPNEHEAEALTGIYPGDPSSVREAAKRLLDASGARHAVIKLGARGAYWMEQGMANGHEFPALSVRPADTTAAGDCFTAAMTLRLIESGDFVSSIRYANAAAALSITRIGAQTSLPTAEEVERFIAEHGDTPLQS